MNNGEAFVDRFWLYHPAPCRVAQVGGYPSEFALVQTPHNCHVEEFRLAEAAFLEYPKSGVASSVPSLGYTV